LVEKIDQPWVKCSADFVSITSGDDGGLKLEITEMKARTSVTTAGLEHERVDRINAERHSAIDSTSPFFKDYISSRAEALQLLHHALAFDCEFVRHVTGDRHGQIISSIRVRFSTEIRDAYGKCLQELKDFLLPWAYDARTDTIPEDILQLAEDESLKDIVGGRQGLVQQFCMWRGLMKLDHPLPPLRGIKPSIHSE